MKVEIARKIKGVHKTKKPEKWGRVMVFNAAFNIISFISWQSDLLVSETRIPGENPRPVASQWQPLSHNVVCSTHLHVRDSNSQLLGL
jgi:hypothetical protein